jgi:hypothetical protein
LESSPGKLDIDGFFAGGDDLARRERDAKATQQSNNDQALAFGLPRIGRQGTRVRRVLTKLLKVIIVVPRHAWRCGIVADHLQGK